MNLQPPAMLVALLLAAAAQAAPQLELTASEPRAFGYQVGDLVQRRLVVHAPDGWSLDAESIPRPGARGQPLELRRVDRHDSDEPGGRRHELLFEYQVFFAPTAVRTLELRPFRLVLRGPARVEELRVEAWPVTVAPLVPVEVSPRRGLGELQPDREPPLVDTAATQRRLGAWAALALVLLGWLATLRYGLPWLTRRRRPFGLAWRELRRLPDRPDDEAWRAACKQLHEALNRSAGEVVFEHALPRFLAAHPAFAPLHDPLQRFLQRSRREFFAGAAREPDDGRVLVELARRCRDAERGGA